MTRHGLLLFSDLDDTEWSNRFRFGSKRVKRAACRPVYQGLGPKPFGVFRIEPQHVGYEQGVLGHPIRVTVGIGVLGILC